jgi:hypothetical protein
VFGCGATSNGADEYDALNQRAPIDTPIAATVRREISAAYRPWNELLGQQLRDAGHVALPEWSSQ